MSGFIDKVISVILVFVMLVLAPLLISYISTDMVTDRLVLNEVSQFIDRVTDKSEITSQDLDDLYMGVNSHGGLFEVEVDRYIRVAYDVGGVVKTTYYRSNQEIDELYDAAGNVALLNVSDVVKVKVKEVGLSSGKRLLWNILRVDSGPTEFSLAGTVR